MRTKRMIGAVLLTATAAGCQGATGATGTNGINGMNGSSCSVNTLADGSVKVACENGSTATIPAGGSCHVANNHNGTYTLSCDDGTYAVVSNGAQGPQGVQGDAGVMGVPGTPGVNAGHTIQFTGVATPVTDAEKRQILASPTAVVNGASSSIGYRTILRSGAVLGTNTFGAVLDATGSAIRDASNNPIVSNYPDFTSFLPIGNALYSITHFEALPGGMYLTTLAQAADGTLTATATRPLDFSGIGGLWNPCAGSVSPWLTHLGSEEYPPDARTIGTATTVADIPSADRQSVIDMVRYWGVAATSATPIATITAVFNPYRYGFPTEITVAANGTATMVKHRAMGRIALELTKVMPDERTAYLTDDGTNTGLYMFIADQAGDLGAGNLYAAKWHQISNFGGGRANLTWVPLGHATDAAVDALIASGTKFADIFDVAAPAAGVCPGGFTSVNVNGVGLECLSLKAGMELAASRLETRRYAAYLGATLEFRKEEGIALDPTGRRLYVAMTAVQYGMEDNQKNGVANTAYDIGGPNDIRLTANPCGAVYALDLGTDWNLQSEYVARNMYSVIEGIPTTYTAPSPYVGNTCDVNGISSPDNVEFLDGYGTLIIGEDTDGHQNDILWAFDLNTRTLTRVQTTPYGSESTGASFYPNLRGHGYLVSVVQHPYTESDQGMLMTPADAQGYVGYVGVLPRMD